MAGTMTVVSEAVLYHFSEDADIRVFRPHAPATNPDHRPAIWAIDAEHAPLYWFPRDCPRVTAWTRPTDDRAVFEAAWGTLADRVHVAESAWLQRLRTTTIFRYELPSSGFVPWRAAAGQWIAESPVEPLDVVAIPDLLEAHVAAAIELRFAPSLWPAHDLAISDDWDFSIVRMRNAQRRR
jgi:hypothetical protein